MSESENFHFAIATNTSFAITDQHHGFFMFPDMCIDNAKTFWFWLLGLQVYRNIVFGIITLFRVIDNRRIFVQILCK
jgi:hypothetical protein